MKEITLTVPKTARYCQLGQLSAQTETIWLVCHGYGQLAPYFIRNFEVLNNGKNVVVAPEGLSRFYLNGVSGRVGASWMTKENRETEIADYITYLNLLSAEILKDAPAGVKLNLLGFSQGAATVCRWLPEAVVNVNKLILWAGVFPEDLDLISLKSKLSQTEVYVVYGDQDEYLTEERLAQAKAFMQQNGLEPTYVTFSGGHKLDTVTLKKLAGLS